MENENDTTILFGMYVMDDIARKCNCRRVIERSLILTMKIEVVDSVCLLVASLEMDHECKIQNDEVRKRFDTFTVCNKIYYSYLEVKPIFFDLLFNSPLKFS